MDRLPKLPRWLIITSLLIFVLLPLLIIYISYFSKEEVFVPLLLKTPLKFIVPQKEISSSDVKFSFISQIPGYTIPEDSIDTSTLSYALDKIGLNPPVDKPFLARSLTDGDRYISPKHVALIFRPIEYWETDKRVDPGLQNRVILQTRIPNGYAYVFLVGELSPDESSLTIPLYINMEELNKHQNLSTSQYLSYYSLTALYYNFHLGPLKYEENIADTVLRLLGTPAIKLFEVTKTSTFFPFRLPKIQLIKPVYAGSCSSGFSAGSCGTWETVSGYCIGMGVPYDGQSCSDSSQCYQPGPPVLSGECIITGGTGDCVSSGTAGDCQNCVTTGGTYYVEFTCGAGCIVSYGACGVASTVTPTSSPTPIPICTVGSWASCGTQGCGACDSPQCNADGSAWNCVANPGGCCPASPFCGDGTCNNGETCPSCPADCWCPPAPSPTPTPITGVGWYQSVGGEIYSSESLRSFIPTGASPRVLVQDGSGGYPGVVTHGGMLPYPGYDFNGDWLSDGETLISSKNWRVFERFDDLSFFDIFRKRFGNPTEATPGFDQINGTKPTNGVYYVEGNATIGSSWTVNDGDSIILLVNGTLTINAPIQLGGTGAGFVAFITSTGITVDTGVGVAPASGVSVLDGVYITSGDLTTGTSTAGIERLNGRGMFIANSVTLQRDLGSTDNVSYPAEQFIYYPRFLITMPDAMRDVPIKWEEVAP